MRFAPAYELVVKKKIEALVTFIGSGGLERWWISLGLSKKTEVLIRAIGVFLLLNACLGAAQVIKWWIRWLGMKPGIDYRAAPPPPGGYYTIELVFVVLAFVYYVGRLRSN